MTYTADDMRNILGTVKEFLEKVLDMLDDRQKVNDTLESAIEYLEDAVKME